MATHEESEYGGHNPVMLREVVEELQPVPPGVVVDATVGAGGHSAALLERRPDLTCIGLDADPEALAVAARRLPERVRLRRRRFDELGEVLTELGVATISGVLFDLGVSSMQLDNPERGFSYRRAGPIDMRMDPEASLCAGRIVNEWSEQRLASLLREYGDEPHSRRIARAVVASRPLQDTLELAAVVRGAIPARDRRRGGHPAKRSFQALRIAVNAEGDQLRPALLQAIEHLVPEGRGVVLSYHSGEDRIVKQTLRDAETGGCTCPRRLPCVCGASGCIRLRSRRPRRPGTSEVRRNPRSASARMRSFAKLEASSP